MKPIRYKQEMVDEFLKDGYWTQELFYDFWERNAREYGDREALVDSKYRLPGPRPSIWWTPLPITWVEMGIPKSPASSFSRPTAFTVSWPGSPAERAGLISLTVYPYLRQRELEYMVERTEASAVVILHVYRKFNYLEMYQGLQKKFPHLKNIFLFDDEVPEEPPKEPFRSPAWPRQRLKSPWTKIS